MLHPVRAQPHELLENIITCLCFKVQPGTTKLMKLVYLVDVYYTRAFGKRLTDVPFVYDRYGAFAKEVYQALEALEAKGVIRERSVQTTEGHEANIRELAIGQASVPVSPEVRQIIEDVLADWGGASLAAVIRYTKATLPFVGTKPSQLIDFSRISPVSEHAKAKGLSEEDVATEAICSNPELVAAIREGDRAARNGKFVSWEDVFGEE